MIHLQIGPKVVHNCQLMKLVLAAQYILDTIIEKAFIGKKAVQKSDSFSAVFSRAKIL